MKWIRVRVSLRCAFGHDIGNGEWALKWRIWGIGFCEEHALEHYHETPPKDTAQDAPE